MTHTNTRLTAAIGLASAAGTDLGLLRIKIFEKPQSVNEIAAINLVDQLKPIRGTSTWRITGNTTPPNAPPVAARPVAYPLLRSK